jgi:hypothetical protein
MFPTAVATSFAYMLPVATPPNAVVFSYGYLKVIDMVCYGEPCWKFNVYDDFVSLNTNYIFVDYLNLWKHLNLICRSVKYI